MKPPSKFRSVGHERAVVEKFDQRVKSVRTSARRLYIYTEGEKTGSPFIKDALVWVRPTEDSTPETIAATVEFMKKHGAVAVRAEPLESKNSVVASSTMAIPVGSDRSVREVVAELLDQVREQPEAVRSIVEGVLGEVGL